MSAIDPEYNNVALLLPMIGKNNGNEFKDFSQYRRYISQVGSPTTKTSTYKFYGISAYFDGASDYLIAPYSDEFDLSTTDFTIEAWIHPLGNSGSNTYGLIIGKQTSGTINDFIFQVTSGGEINFTCTQTNGTKKAIVASGAVTYGQWAHVAACRSGNDIELYINGVSVGTNTLTTAIDNRTYGINIGKYNGVASGHYYGYMQDVRITLARRYTQNFTPAARGLMGVINATIGETLATDQFVVNAYDAKTGEAADGKVITGASFSLDKIPPSWNTANVSVAPYYGDLWQPNMVYTVDDTVLPGDPSTTPYYYKRLIAGTSGSSAPPWVGSPGATVDDNGVTGAWQCVERIVQPITHGPLIPA